LKKFCNIFHDSIYSNPVDSQNQYGFRFFSMLTTTGDFVNCGSQLACQETKEGENDEPSIETGQAVTKGDY
jgi:hypothetical protein